MVMQGYPSDCCEDIVGRSLAAALILLIILQRRVGVERGQDMLTAQACLLCVPSMRLRADPLTLSEQRSCRQAGGRGKLERASSPLRTVDTVDSRIPE